MNKIFTINKRNYIVGRSFTKLNNNFLEYFIIVNNNNIIIGNQAKTIYNNNLINEINIFSKYIRGKNINTVLLDKKIYYLPTTIYLRFVYLL